MNNYYSFVAKFLKWYHPIDKIYGHKNSLGYIENHTQYKDYKILLYHNWFFISLNEIYGNVFKTIEETLEYIDNMEV